MKFVPFNTPFSSAAPLSPCRGPEELGPRLKSFRLNYRGKGPKAMQDTAGDVVVRLFSQRTVIVRFHDEASPGWGAGLVGRPLVFISAINLKFGSQDGRDTRLD